MVWELFLEIYWPIVFVLSAVWAVVYVILLILFFARLAIRYINDDERPVYYFFTGDESGWVHKATLGTNHITCTGEPGAIKHLECYGQTDENIVLAGMGLVPIIYIVGILLWPATLIILCAGGTLEGTRSVVRFKKKVEMHMEHLQN